MVTTVAEIRRCLRECAEGLNDALSAAQPGGWRTEIPQNLNIAVTRQIRESIREVDKYGAPS